MYRTRTIFGSMYNKRARILRILLYINMRVMNCWWWRLLVLLLRKLAQLLVPLEYISWFSAFFFHSHLQCGFHMLLLLLFDCCYCCYCCYCCQCYMLYLFSCALNGNVKMCVCVCIVGCASFRNRVQLSNHIGNGILLLLHIYIFFIVGFGWCLVIKRAHVPVSHIFKNVCGLVECTIKYCMRWEKKYIVNAHTVHSHTYIHANQYRITSIWLSSILSFTHIFFIHFIYRKMRIWNQKKPHQNKVQQFIDCVVFAFNPFIRRRVFVYFLPFVRIFVSYRCV